MLIRHTNKKKPLMRAAFPKQCKYCLTSKTVDGYPTNKLIISSDRARPAAQINKVLLISFFWFLVSVNTAMAVVSLDYRSEIRHSVS